jgi:hypothetical protein
VDVGWSQQAPKTKQNKTKQNKTKKTLRNGQLMVALAVCVLIRAQLGTIKASQTGAQSAKRQIKRNQHKGTDLDT